MLSVSLGVLDNAHAVKEIEKSIKLTYEDAFCI